MYGHSRTGRCVDLYAEAGLSQAVYVRALYTSKASEGGRAPAHAPAVRARATCAAHCVAAATPRQPCTHQHMHEPMRPISPMTPSAPSCFFVPVVSVIGTGVDHYE